MKKKHTLRYFFTATEEAAKWIERESKRLGLSQSEVIKMITHKVATESK
jgi:antitoxin component of RelBE/YafQ-DinJ toxin-antitoxin module